MGDQTNIEWCDRTFNPFIGCTKVSPGCDNCYAEKLMDHRMHKVIWGAGQARVRTSRANWRKPLAWNKAHAEFYAAHGRRQRVFCASLADVFDNAVSPSWRADLFELIEKTPNLDWLLLTKRIGNVPAMVDDVGRYLFWIDKDDDYIPPNVWLGATIVNQEEADRDIPKLLAVPAARRFLSMEPLLGGVDLTLHLWGRATACADCPKDADCGCGWYPRGAIDGEPGIDWVIVGGESGTGARPKHPEWTRSLRDQCAAAGVPFLFKQWGEWHPSDAHPPISHRLDIETVAMHADGRTEYRSLEVFGLSNAPGWSTFCRVGKKAAGRLLDGVQHDGYPVGEKI